MNDIKLVHLLANRFNDCRYTNPVSRLSCNIKKPAPQGQKSLSSSLLLRNLIVLLTVSLLILLAQLANAQAEHVIQAGSYTLRASALNSEFIPSSVAKEHNIDRAPDRGVMNVVVLRKNAGGKDATVPAEVIAYQRNLIGQRETIEMRPVKQNDRITYLGTFDFDSPSNLHFIIEAKPQGSDENITLEFEERFQ